MTTRRVLHLDEKKWKRVLATCWGGISLFNQHPTLLASVSARSPGWRLSRITNTAFIDHNYYL